MSTTTQVGYAAPAGRGGTAAKLSVMMFLQYAVWGVWLPYLANYLQGSTDKGGLGFSNAQIGWILGLAGSIGAVFAPFVAGQIADRFLNAEKALGLLLIGGGIVNYWLASVHGYGMFLVLSIVYSILYMPTLSLTNSVAFANLGTPEKQFPKVRVWGTVGWIVASNAFPLIWLQMNLHPTIMPPFLAGTEKANSTALLGDCLRVAGVMAVLYGIWAMVGLPATPPTRKAESPLAFTRAFALLKNPGFLVVTLVSLPIAMIHQVYFFRTGPFLEALGFAQAKIGPIMSIGQVSEICFLAALGFFLARLGFKWTLVLGCIAYTLRFALFGMATRETAWLVVAANALHGLCYGCFFAGAFIYVERVATPDIRHSAQTVFGIIILGVGPVLAGIYNQVLDGALKTAGSTSITAFNYSAFWYIQAGIALLSMIVLAAAFRPGISAATTTEAAAAGAALKADEAAPA